MLLAACHGSCRRSCSVSLQWIQRSLCLALDPPNTCIITPIDWHPYSGVWQLTPVVIQSWFDFDIGARKNTRKRPKHFAIYLDKTLLIPACGELWENGCWLMFRVIKKLGQCLTGQLPTGWLHHQDTNDQRMCLVNSCVFVKSFYLSQGNLGINLVWCLDIWLTPIMRCVRLFTPVTGPLRGRVSLVWVQELLTFYPIIRVHRPENGLKSTILNLPFLTWLPPESTKITMQCMTLK